METPENLVNKKIISVLSIKKILLFSDISQTKEIKEKINVELEKMSLIEKYKLLYELTKDDNSKLELISGNIKAIKNWISFWSILFIVSVPIVIIGYILSH